MYETSYGLLPEMMNI